MVNVRELVTRVFGGSVFGCEEISHYLNQHVLQVHRLAGIYHPNELFKVQFGRAINKVPFHVYQEQLVRIHNLVFFLDKFAKLIIVIIVVKGKLLECVG